MRDHHQIKRFAEKGETERKKIIMRVFGAFEKLNRTEKRNEDTNFEDC